MPDDMYIQAMTYNVSLQKTYFENLKSALTATYSRMSNQLGKLSNVANIRLSGGYTLAKKHSFNLSMTMLSSENTTRRRLQYAANLSYVYNFNVTIDRKDKKLKTDYSF